MSPALKTLLWLVVLIDAYVLIYYRLLVKHYYEQAQGVTEGTFWTILSLPPYTPLPEAGRKYARRYWWAMAVLIACVSLLALTADFSILSGPR